MATMTEATLAELCIGDVIHAGAFMPELGGAKVVCTVSTIVTVPTLTVTFNLTYEGIILGTAVCYANHQGVCLWSCS